MTAITAKALSKAHLAQAACAVCALGGFLGLLGPFGSYLNHGTVSRIVYWVAATWLGLALYAAAIIATRRIAPPGGRAFWCVLAGFVLIASVPQAFLTRGGALLLWPALGHVLPGWTAWYAQVLAIGLPSTLGGAVIFTRLRRPMIVGLDTEPPPASKDSTTSLGTGILALQMEDHYVRVHTHAGSTLHLMSMTRAIDAIAPLTGLRVHRSWWVARHAVRQIDGPARAMRLTLANGVTAPVSRANVSVLRAAEWLAAPDKPN
ncbi:LytTR family DNA-binding domain-containing protein [Gluconacetobacter tumulicola]|uniref:LytTR family transcriptional regulator n=1 Tax=Gluconacetobacter tumulicola TaxID=1017177 RepID=A0A7W4P7X8_9PROT|nr:LytTR family DNA-binding domain-containing protein [Gluconacetobacter tumulicola]MBB2180642.1 LytTR family transcriptional regulator [Gluconacetobacter tumulicola]